MALAVAFSLSALLFFFWTWRWPLIGDASLMHYIVFLMERGWAPYRDFGDMNMPGSYLVELAGMHVFGMGALAWRLFDFTLLGLAAVAFFVIARRGQWLAGLFAASLFILIHGRDGVEQGGQRDLTMAVCLIAGTALLAAALRAGAWSKRVPWLAAAFGLLSGVALAIKPSIGPLSLVQWGLAAWALGSGVDQRRPMRARGVAWRYAAPAVAGWLLAPAVVVVFLVREHALAAFGATLREIVPYYAGLGHRPLGYILLHGISPLQPLVIIWFLLLALRPLSVDWRRDWERNLLVAGALFSLISCIVQARALPYYRYPLLAFLLPLMGLDLARTFAAWARTVASARMRTAGTLSALALGFAGFFLAPQSAVLIHRYRWWQTDFIASLEENLLALGGAGLSHHVQCIDTNRGCGNVLYDMRLEPVTGVLSDFLLLGKSDEAAVRETRAEFSRQVENSPPWVIVVSSPLYLDALDDYRKLDRWPAFASFLRDDYVLETQWTPKRMQRLWSREELPAGYRVYVLRTYVQRGIARR